MHSRKPVKAEMQQTRQQQTVHVMPLMQHRMLLMLLNKQLMKHRMLPKTAMMTRQEAKPKKHRVLHSKHNKKLVRRNSKPVKVRVVR